MSSSLPMPSLRGRASIPSPACGGGLGRGPSAVRLAVAAMMEETYWPSSFVPAEASGQSPLPTPPPQAGEGARGAAP
jgi:hypothetical protein